MKANDMRKLHLLGVIVLGLFAQGCDTSGLHPLNAPIDYSSNCGRSTWMRSTATGTEIFLLGELEPSTPVTEDGVCFVRAFVEHDSSSFVEQGHYTLDANGVGVFTVNRLYTFTYQPELGPTKREGADVNDSPSPSSHELAITMDGEEVVLSLDGEARRLTNIYDVIARLDPTAASGEPGGPEDIYRMFNLTLFTSQVRVLSFGGAGMTMYAGSTKSFQALVGGDFSINVKLGFPDVVTTISYFGYEDLHGVTIEGDQITIVDLSGSGGMEGALEWTMRGSDDPGDVLLSGSLSYLYCEITNGVASGGYYLLTVDGQDHEVSYTVAADSDLRGILPESTP